MKKLPFRIIEKRYFNFPYPICPILICLYRGHIFRKHVPTGSNAHTFLQEFEWCEMCGKVNKDFKKNVNANGQFRDESKFWDKNKW